MSASRIHIQFEFTTKTLSSRLRIMKNVQNSGLGVLRYNISNLVLVTAQRFH